MVTLCSRLGWQQSISWRALSWTGKPGCSSIEGGVSSSVFFARRPTVVTWHLPSGPFRAMPGCWKTSDLHTESHSRVQEPETLFGNRGHNQARSLQKEVRVAISLPTFFGGSFVLACSVRAARRSFPLTFRAGYNFHRKHRWDGH